MTGVVLLVEEPKGFAGTSKTGKPYSFVQRRFQLWTGNKAVEVSDRLPEQVSGQPVPTFKPLVPMSQVTVKVTNIRPNGLNLNFDVEILS